MNIEEKIKTKYAQFGKLVHYEKTVESNTVDTLLFTPGIGTKMKDIRAHADDVEQIIGKSGVRVLAPVPDTNYIGFEVPREERTFVTKELHPKGFELEIGVDSMNSHFTYDVREAPHMLIAGATGSGKSVFLSSVIDQLLKVDNTSLVLFDPKMVELSMYEQEDKVVLYEDNIYRMNEELKDLIQKMESRYRLFKTEGVRDIKEYNKAVKKKMDYMFVIIEEFGDLMTTTEVRIEEIPQGFKKDGEPKKPKIVKHPIRKEIHNSVLKLAQKARACGIHLIISTQRPSVDVISGTIKANFPVKVGLRMGNVHDSKVVFGESGAEKLLGKGDLLFANETGVRRLQGYTQQ
jgi:S-DNA-T family DNA segregation ATPase FtsK/SpoIIIE